MGSGPYQEQPKKSQLAGFMGWILAAVVVALVVEGLDQFNHKAAVMLAGVIILLVLISRSDILAPFAGTPIVGQYSRSGNPMAGAPLRGQYGRSGDPMRGG